VLYTDGNEARLGDKVAIDGGHRGVVVACIDRGEYSADHPAAQWSYLGRGVIIDTSFGGLVHYVDASIEDVVLLERGS
jgi:hypothetical protein